jgi:transcriptional regulator with XRE-family HTH domain
MSPFSKKLRDLRESRKIRQIDAAELLGYEQSYLSALETGSKGVPKKEFIARVEKIYQLNQQEMIELMLAYAQSSRTLVLPRSASIDSYLILNRLKTQIGNLKPLQLQLISTALDIGELKM